VTRCIVFDFDGTLVDSNPGKRQSFFDVVSAHDRDGDVVREVLDTLVDGDRYDVMREVAQRLWSRGRLPQDAPVETWADRFAAAYTRRCEEIVSKCDEIPGATTALESLRERGLPCYVDSATPEEPLRRVIALRGWTHYFHGAFGRPASKFDILGIIAEDAGVAPGEIVLVGDSDDDRSAADAFGCGFIAVVRPGSQRFSRPPGIRIPDLRDLTPTLQRLEDEAP
jgi:phosphoglycolate phosphatase-like HAD superfamily hydrolase